MSMTTLKVQKTDTTRFEQYFTNVIGGKNIPEYAIGNLKYALLAK